MSDLWPIPPNTPEAAAAIERVQKLLRGQRVDPPAPRKPTPIKVSNRCEYKRDGVRCGRKGSMTREGYRCPTHSSMANE